MDRAAFIAMVTDIRGWIRGGTVRVLDELSTGDVYAERHVFTITMNDGSTAEREVAVFGRFAEDGLTAAGTSVAGDVYGRHGCLGSANRPRTAAVLRLAAEVVHRPRVSDEVFDDARRHLSEREIVEVLQVAGYYWSFCRICIGRAVSPERGQGATASQRQPLIQVRRPGSWQGRRTGGSARCRSAGLRPYTGRRPPETVEAQAGSFQALADGNFIVGKCAHASSNVRAMVPRRCAVARTRPSPSDNVLGPRWSPREVLQMAGLASDSAIRSAAHSASASVLGSIRIPKLVRAARSCW